MKRLVSGRANASCAKKSRDGPVVPHVARVQSFIHTQDVPFRSINAIIPEAIRHLKDVSNAFFFFLFREGSNLAHFVSLSLDRRV